MTKKYCPACNKEQHLWAFADVNDSVCGFHEESSFKPAEIKKHSHEEVEDTGCAGGACTL